MSLKETLAADMKAAMKAREAVRLGVIRMMSAELQKTEIAKGTLSEADEVDVLARQAKQRRESIEAYDKAGRKDLADKEREELAILESYLPKQLTRDEVEALAKETMAELGVTQKKDMGKVMGALMPKLRGRFPGKDVGPIVQGLLS